jgi:hypothetical protein
MRYNENANPRCRKDNVGCADSTHHVDHCDLKDGTTATALTAAFTCPSLGCVDSSKCVKGALVSANNEASEVCFTDFLRHGCNVGEVCNASGQCVGVAPLGAPCPSGLCAAPNSCQTDYTSTDYCCANVASCTGGCATCNGKQKHIVCCHTTPHHTTSSHYLLDR